MNYFETGLKIISILQSEGYSSFIVGGAARDYLLNQPYTDIDITTSALPKDVSAIFDVKTKGIKYNSVVIKYDGYLFETTTFRKEKAYLDNRHPEYEVAKTLEEDLKRRDFTINAFALDKDLKVVDLFDGKKDLENKLIRAIGNPSVRFEEDALRILRAIYFAAKLNFEIEKTTYKALKEKAYLVQRLSFERVKEEMEKILLSQYSLKGFKYLIDSNVVSYLKDFQKGINLIVRNKIENLNLIEFYALCYYGADYDKLPNDIKRDLDDIYFLLKSDLTDLFINFKYRHNLVLSANFLRKILKIKSYNEKDIEAIYQSLPIHELYELKISGNDVKKITNQDGKMIGTILDDVLNRVLKKKIDNNYVELSKYILKKYKK